MRAWVISRHADVQQVLNDPRTFSSRFALGVQHATVFDPLRERMHDDPRARTASRYFRMAIEEGDGQVHTRERGFIAKAFTPKRVRRFERLITDTCAELIAPMLGRCDVEFVDEFAAPLPVKVIAYGLGLPLEQWRTLKRWSDQFQGPIGDCSPEKLEGFVTAAVEFTDCIAPLIEERRRAPGEDLISVLVGANSDGDRLNDDEILAVCMALMLGGDETTAMGLSGSMLFLVRAHHIQEQLRANPELIPTFIEDALRLASPVQLLFRTATADTVVAGSNVAKDEHVLLRINAANRDPARYEQPLVPRLDRRDKRHLAFGRGVHVCPGAPLARLELRIAFETLLARTTSITLADRAEPVVPAGNPMTAAVGELHLDLRSSRSMPPRDSVPTRRRAS